MKKYILLGFFAFVVTQADAADTIANCGPLKGVGYYHHQGMITEKLSGFQEEKIDGGINTFQKTAPDQYDILVLDARKQIISLTRDGGKVVLLRKGKQDATFLHFHPGMAIEIYTLWIDAEGIARYDLVQSKGGDGMPIHKSSVLTGTCESIRMDLID